MTRTLRTAWTLLARPVRPIGAAGLLTAALLAAGGCQTKQKAELETAPPPPPPASDPFGVERAEPGFREADMDLDAEPAVETEPAEPAASANEVTFTSTPTPAPAAPRTHVVRKGDTLWSLAQRYYGDGQRWVDIVQANPGIDPKKLAVGQEITIP